MKHFIKLATLAIAMFTFSITSANAAPEMKKMGVVYPSKIMAETAQRDKIIAKLQQEFKKRSDELQALQFQINKSNKKLSRDTEMMSPNEISILKRDVEVKIFEYKLKLKAFEDDNRRRQAEEQQAVVQKLGKVINSVAKKGGYDLVLNGDQIVYAKPGFDISDIVIKEISKK